MRTDVDFIGQKGKSSFVQLLRPSSHRALLLVVHGAGACFQTYIPFAYEMAMRGYAVATLDLPGHGLSDGIPTHIRRYEDYLSAIGDALTWAIEKVAPEEHGVGSRARDADSPDDSSRGRLPLLYLTGESYGAVLVLHYALRRQEHIAGLVLSAPAFGIQVPAWQLKLVQAMARLCPRVRLPRGSTAAVSSHPVAARIVARSPLLHRRLTARYVAELLKAGRDAAAAIHRLQKPVLVLTSNGDKVVDNNATRAAFDRIACVDKTWYTQESQAHALLIDDPEGMATQVAKWIASRLPATPHA